MNAPKLNRRDFLRTTGSLVGAAALPGAAFGAVASSAFAPKYKTERIIVVAFAGGVRSRDTIGTPENVPNLMKIARSGVLFPNTRSSNLGHFGAALSIFTGTAEVQGIRENDRGDHPTLFEYLRKQLGLPANDVWLSATGGVQQQNFTHSYHRGYGAAYGANLISSDGIFNSEFQGILNSFGKVRDQSEPEAEVLAKLRGALSEEFKNRGSVAADLNSPDALRSIEKFILDELNQGTSRITGPGAGDAKTVRVGGNLFRGFKPKVLGIVLQQHDVAHSSYNGYVEVIRRNDQELGRLWDGIQADPKLRMTTSIFILPEFGRNKDLNERNGLDHGDGSTDINVVSIIAAGPDFKREQIIKKEVLTLDVCPTVCELLGARPEHAKGRILRDAFLA
jgi:hypothetical protein